MNDTSTTPAPMGIIQRNTGQGTEGCGVGAEEDVRRSLEALRRGQGLSALALEHHDEVLSQLGTDDPFVAYERLSRLVHKLGDARPGITLRAVLAVGFDRLKDAKERRAAIEEQLRISDSVRWRDEREALNVLTRLVMQYAPFKEEADQRLIEANQVAPFTPIDATDVDGALSDATQLVQEQADHASTTSDEDSLDQDDTGESVEPADSLPAGLRAKMRAIKHDLVGVFGWREPGPLARPVRPREIIALAAGMVAIGVVITLGATGVIPSSLNHASSTSSTPSTRPSAAITNEPVEKIDNTGGWGPSRKTFTGAAPYAVLNSLTNMPGFGDERNFFSCHDLANHDPSGWGNNLLAEDGHTYQCELFADNDVSPTFDPSLSPGGQRNIAVMLQNTRARVLLPNPELNPALYGIVNADNSNPPEVWDAVNFISPKKVTLTYQAGSARLFTTSTDSVPLKDDTSLTADGALLGDKQDGYLGQKAEYILFNVTVKLG